MAKSKAIYWLDEPKEHNYPAAQSYLSLQFDERTAAAYVRKLRAAAVVEFKSKDIFRASRLSLLGVSNSHVVRDLKKIGDGDRLSPLLLVRRNASAEMIVADGYHRLCAVYSLNEDAVIRCKIV